VTDETDPAPPRADDEMSRSRPTGRSGAGAGVQAPEEMRGCGPRLTRRSPQRARRSRGRDRWICARRSDLHPGRRRPAFCLASQDRESRPHISPSGAPRRPSPRPRSETRFARR
jgi:hypothetical protein